MANDRNSPDFLSSPSADILRVAAEWRARHDAGLNPAEEQAFAAWLERDERHAAAFAELDDTWNLLDRAREVPVETLGVSEQLLARDRGPATTSRLRAWWLAPLVAAAALAIGIYWERPTIPLPKTDFAKTASADAGAIRRLNLPDGSVVRLNSRAEVTLRFSNQERRVVLARGEAYFEIAKDSARPFVVAARGVDVLAVGTAFSVAHRNDTVEVLVTEGTVRVEGSATRTSLLETTAPRPADRSSTNRLLAAGEKAVIPLRADAPSGAAEISTLPPTAVTAALAWSKRMLEFDATALAAIVAEFNRHNSLPLVIADERLAEQRFSGSFQADDPETFVALLQARGDVAVERTPTQVLLRARGN